MSIPIRYRYKKIKICKLCARKYNPSRLMQAYCGYSCASKVRAEAKWRNHTKVRICLTCKKKFIKRNSDLKIYGNRVGRRGLYCSQKCWKSKVQNVSSLKMKAWLIFALYIKNRDNWTCFTCGKTERGPSMHAGHFVSRSHNSTLFDEMNVNAQCAWCNMFRNGQPHVYAEKLIQIHGQMKFMELVRKSRETKQFSKQELLEIHDFYKAKLSTFRNLQ